MLCYLTDSFKLLPTLKAAILVVEIAICSIFLGLRLVVHHGSVTIKLPKPISLTKTSIYKSRRDCICYGIKHGLLQTFKNRASVAIVPTNCAMFIPVSNKVNQISLVLGIKPNKKSIHYQKIS